MKNHSSGVKGIFGGGGGNNSGSGNAGPDDTLRNYDGMLPNLNITKKECK